MWPTAQAVGTQAGRADDGSPVRAIESPRSGRGHLAHGASHGINGRRDCTPCPGGAISGSGFQLLATRPFEHPDAVPPGLAAPPAARIPRLARRGLQDHARFTGFRALLPLKLALMGCWPGPSYFAPLGLKTPRVQPKWRSPTSRTARSGCATSSAPPRRACAAPPYSRRGALALRLPS